MKKKFVEFPLPYTHLALYAVTPTGPDVLAVSVNVSKWRQAFDRVEFLITPVAGTGCRWVMAEKLFSADDGRTRLTANYLRAAVLP